jgi:hypothetical protein
VSSDIVSNKDDDEKRAAPADSLPGIHSDILLQSQLCVTRNLKMKEEKKRNEAGAKWNIISTSRSKIWPAAGIHIIVGRFCDHHFCRFTKRAPVREKRNTFISSLAACVTHRGTRDKGTMDDEGTRKGDQRARTAEYREKDSECNDDPLDVMVEGKWHS